MELTEFLLARIAEDEAVAHGGKRLGSPPGIPYDAWERQTRRSLAECEAKRRIVALWAEEWPEWHGFGCVLGYLALPYADHPDYREEWRP